MVEHAGGRCTMAGAPAGSVPHRGPRPQAVSEARATLLHVHSAGILYRVASLTEQTAPRNYT
jgi:hypothetical protein